MTLLLRCETPICLRTEWLFGLFGGGAWARQLVRSPRARRPHEQRSAVGERHFAAVRAPRAVLRLVAVDFHLGPGLQRLLREAPTEEHVRCPGLESPRLDRAVGLLH